jgi:phosphohistidine phosphatase
LTPNGTGADLAPVPFVLDILRHGEALAAGAGGDGLRPLSPRGRSDLERLAAHLQRMGWRPDRVFTSPLTRARETAAIVIARALPGLEAGVLNALLPECDPVEVLAALAEQGATSGHVLIVGHQPQLGTLAAGLAPATSPALAPAHLVRIRFAGSPRMGAGELALRLSPSQLP